MDNLFYHHHALPVVAMLCLMCIEFKELVKTKEKSFTNSNYRTIPAFGLVEIITSLGLCGT